MSDPTSQSQPRPCEVERQIVVSGSETETSSTKPPAALDPSLPPSTSVKFSGVEQHSASKSQKPDAVVLKDSVVNGPALVLSEQAEIDEEVRSLLPLCSSSDRAVALDGVRHLLSFVNQQNSLPPSFTPAVCTPLMKALVGCLRRHRADLETAVATLSAMWCIIRASDAYAKLLSQCSGVSVVVNVARDHTAERRVVAKVYRILKAVGASCPLNDQNPLVARKFNGVSLYRRLLDTLGQRQFRNFSNLLLLIRYL